MADKTLIFTLLFCLLLLTKAQDSVSAYIQTSHDQPTLETVLDTTSSDQRNTRQDIFPIQTPEIYGFILLMIFAGLANSGGLGGGTLLTPLLIIVFNYSEKNAVEMVYALVFGGSVGNFINLVTKRDPKTNKPLIEYDLGLVCMPLMLLGATIGVILNRMLAPLVTLAGLLAVILYSLTRMYIKARKQYADETKQILQDALVVKKEINVELSQAVNPEAIQDQLQVVNPELQAILEEDQLLFPKKKLAVTGSLIVIIILLALFRGTQSFDSIVGVPYCGAVYWLIVALTVVICAIALWINLRLLKEPLRIKKEHGLVARPGRFELTEDQIGKLIMLSLIAGILAGLLGIGGGMVMGPTLISIGVPAQGLAATSGFFIVQTSFISLVQACLYKDLPLQDQGFLMLLAIIGSFGVSYVLNMLVRKYKRPSLVLFTLMLVLTTSLIATPVFEILTNLHNFGLMMSFSPVC